MTCPLCNPDLEGQLVLRNQHCLFLQQTDLLILPGSGIIIPGLHRETLFDLTLDEWNATHELLQRAKDLIDEQLRPQGYNIGWNVGAVGGQEVFHAHLHVIPRYDDEPLAGKGIRYWLRQPTNMRKQTDSTSPFRSER